MVQTVRGAEVEGLEDFKEEKGLGIYSEVRAKKSMTEIHIFLPELLMQLPYVCS